MVNKRGGVIILGGDDDDEVSVTLQEGDDKPVEELGEEETTRR